MPNPRRRRAEETYAGHRHAWATNDTINAVIYLNDEERKFGREVGDDIVMILQQKSRVTKITLTHMTGPELDALQLIFTEAFALAREVCDERDSVAQAHYAKTGEPYRRLYRRPAILAHRTGSFREYGESVWQRLKDVSRVVRTPDKVLDPYEPMPITDNLRAPRIPGASGSEVVKRVTKEEPGNDGEPTSLESSDVRDVGQDSRVHAGLQATDPSEGSASSDS